jgi:hypothetical protein
MSLIDRVHLLVVCLLGLAFVGCSEDAGLCVRASDCPSGQICADGICTPEGKTDGPSSDGVADLRLDAGSEAWIPDYATLDGDAGQVCTPNNNGKVERQEMVFSVPSKVTVTLGTNLVVDLAGTQVGGVTSWDLSGAATDDKDVEMKVEALPTWTASKFPGATYASRMTANFGFFTKVDLLGVFQVTPTALQLMGAVSDKSNHTRVTYSKPLDALRFPVVKGDSYKTSASMTGFSDYTIPVANTESYEIDVLDSGKLKLLSGLTLDALLVRVRQEVWLTLNPLMKTKTTVFLFVSECYGTVARVIADKDPGTALDKVTAKERWKLAAP